MTDHNASDRDVTRAIRSWLDEDRHEDASRIAAAVLDRVEATPRRRPSWWPARRTPTMNKIFGLAAGAAAVVAVTAVGINLLPWNGSGAGGPQPSPSPTAVPRVPSSGSIEPGTYLVTDGDSTFRVTFPAGWDVVDGQDFRKHRDQRGELSFGIYSRDINVWPDSCATRELPPSTGPTADDLVAALLAQENSDVSEPAEITIDGLPGVRLDVSVPEGLDTAACVPEALRIWSDAADNANRLAFGGPGTTPIYIVETPSGRIVLGTGADPVATAPDKAELQAVLDSIDFEP